MSRFASIQSVSFGQTSLGLPLSVRIARTAQTVPAAGDNDAFTTSIQLGTSSVVAEVRVRDVAVAEDLVLGQKATLSLRSNPTESGQAGRDITLAGAVLIAIEIAYEQASMAAATLRFIAEADQGATDPFDAENAA